MNRILITGGTGFIGKHIIAPLIKRGYEIHVTTSQPTHFLPDNVQIHHADLLNESEHKRLMKLIRPSHLLHAAWYTKNGKFWDAIENVYWLKATLSLAEAFFQSGGYRLVGLGTCAEYDWHHDLCKEEQTSVTPTSFYGKVKQSTYHCLNALSTHYSTSFAWGRIFFPYGPGEAESRLIPHVITNLLRDNEAKCTHGEQVRDFLHVFDIGHALAAMLDSNVTGALNIASGIPVTIKEIVNHIAKTLGREHLVKFGAIPEPPHSPQQILADTTRLTKELHWAPALTLHDGLLNTIHWWQEMDKINLLRGAEIA